MKENTLEIHISNNRPIELVDLANSMTALENEFHNFCEKKDAGINAKLYVNEVRKGSVVIDLVSSIPALMPLVDNVNAVLEFGSHLNGICSFLSGKSSEKPATMDVESLKNFRKIVRPVAKDSGARISVSVKESPGAVVNVVFEGNDRQMSSYSKKAEIEEEVFRNNKVELIEKAVFFLTQIRKGDGKNGVGDRGTINSVCDAPKKLIFIDDNVKKLIIDSPENAFSYGYIADVEVERNGDFIVAYRIKKFYERFEP